MSTEIYCHVMATGSSEWLNSPLIGLMYINKGNCVRFICNKTLEVV